MFKFRKDSTKELAKAIANFQSLYKEVKDISNSVEENSNKLEELNYKLIDKNKELLKAVGY